MTSPIAPSPEQLESAGLSADRAASLHTSLSGLFDRLAGAEAWSAVGSELLRRQDPWPAHRLLFDACYRGWDERGGPPPAWLPSPAEIADSNVGRTGLAWDDLHARSIEQPESFWSEALDRLQILLAKVPRAMVEGTGAEARWLPGATLNIASSCLLNRDPSAVAIVHRRPGGPLQRVSVQELHERADLVARCLREGGFEPGDVVALHLPMGVEAVVLHLGVVLAGCAAATISHSCTAEQIRRRLIRCEAKAIVTQDVLLRGGASLPLYTSAIEAQAPRAIVLPASGTLVLPLRGGDCSYGDFLSTAPGGRPKAHRSVPESVTTVLFSEDEAGLHTIPWTQTTPIKAATDGWAHQDIRPGDVVAWPTELGGMQAPWLIYAALLNGATLALFEGDPATREFCSFVQDADVTMLGHSPELLRAWRAGGLLAGLDWDALRCFSTAGGASSADDVLWLMSRVNYRIPVVEYRGVPELGGACVAGTVAQGQAPATFSTAAIGCSIDLLDAHGRPAEAGELSPSQRCFGSTAGTDRPLARLQRLPGGGFCDLDGSAKP